MQAKLISSLLQLTVYFTYLEELKLWKPNGEDWKLKREIGLQILANLKEDLNEERKGEHFIVTYTILDSKVQPVFPVMCNTIQKQIFNNDLVIRACLLKAM